MGQESFLWNMKSTIRKWRYNRKFWFEDDLVWIPKAQRPQAKRNIFALKKDFIIEIAKEIKALDNKC